MRLVRRSGMLWLEHEGRHVQVDDTDLFYLVRMTPMGRKVYFRNKARTILRAAPSDPVAETLVQWCRLSAQVWSFDPLLTPEG